MMRAPSIALDRAAHGVGDRIRGDRHRDVAHDVRARPTERMSTAPIDAAGVADRVSEDAERAGFVRHLEAHDDQREADRRLSHANLA